MLHRVVAASVRLLLFQPLGLAWHSEHQATEAGFAYNRINRVSFVGVRISLGDIEAFF